MFNADILTFQEYIIHEELPLATIQTAILEFLDGRDDVALFGAQAVNAYVSEPRMTQDIDVLSTRAAETTQALRDYLADRFHIAVRIRQVSEGHGYRLYQVRKSGNRYLVDVRQTEALPQIQRVSGVPVIAPADLIASKVISYYQRRGKPKSGTDWRDMAMLLLAFPELKQETGLVYDCLQKANAFPEVLAQWREFVAQELEPEDDEGEFF
ncbi:MAG: hypothetical protein Fur0021_31110 [Candidatus Promineifilaceae bacterium]